MRRFTEQLIKNGFAEVTTPKGTRCTITIDDPAKTRYLEKEIDAIWQDIGYNVQIHGISKYELPVCLSCRWDWDDFVTEWKI